MIKLTNIELEELQSYMEGKSIAVVGNGKCILDKAYGKDIDSHDVVVRINGGAPAHLKYPENAGLKHDIYSINMDSAHHISRGNQAKYILRLNPLGKNKLDDKQIRMLKLFPNLYYAFGLQQKQIKKLASTYPFSSELNNLKRPSTGAWTLEFLVKNIEFNYISLYGFDFFKEFKKSRGNNIFNSHLSYKHDPDAERHYFENIINKYDIRYNGN